MAAADYNSVVQQLYVAYFGRPADPVGLSNFTTALNNAGAPTTAAGLAAAYSTNSTIKTLVDSFGNSTESSTLYTGTTVAFVNAIYQNVLNRDADLEGLLFWSNAITNGTLSKGDAALSILAGALSNTSTQGLVDAAVVANKVSVATNFTAAVDTASEVLAYSGDTAAASARTMLKTVTDTTDTTAFQTTVTSTLSSIVTTSTTTASTGSSYSLTTAADVITGTSLADTITANGGTLSTSDEINGGAGNDTLTVKVASAIGAPLVSNVETITLEARDAAGTFDFQNVSGATTINIGGITNIAVSGLANSGSVTLQGGYSANVTLSLATNTATAQAFTVNLNDASGADIIIGTDSSTTAADVLTLNAVTNYANGSSMNFSGMEQLVLKGGGDVNLNFDSASHGMSADAIADLTAIKATGLSGALTLTYDKAVSIDIVGGAGNDTFIMTANIDTNDTIDGGAGTDTLNAILTGAYVRPIVSNVETLNLATTSAITADFRDVSGVSTVSLLMASAGMLLDKVGSSVTTINVDSAANSATNLTVDYGTGAAASVVTLNLGLGTSVLNTANASASTISLGDVAFSGNSGSFTLKTDSTAAYSADALTLKDFTAVTLNAASANLALSAIDVGQADTLTLTLAAGKKLTAGSTLAGADVQTLTVNGGQSSILSVTGTMTLVSATDLTINAGASASVDLAGIVATAATAITLHTDASAAITVDTITIGEALSASTNTGTVSLHNLNINASGDVTITALTYQSADASTAMDLNVTVTMANTSVDVTLNAFQIEGASGDATFTLKGSGNFNLTAGTQTGAAGWHIDASNLGSGTVSINLAGVDDKTAVACAVFGSSTVGTYVGVDGVDNIQVNAGAVTVDGGLGNDTITFLSTAANYAHMSAGTTDQGVDTVVGASTGDVILFGGFDTAATALTGGAVLNTGTATNSAQIATAALSATYASGTDFTAAHHLAIYTSNGDTIIEVLVNSGTLSAGSAMSGGDYQRIVLSNKDLTAAITAMFQVNTTGTGLSITLL